MKKHHDLRRSLPRLMVAALLLSAAGACSTSSTAPPAAETAARLNFTQMQPLSVLVGAVDITSTYNPAADPKDQSNLYPVTPETALRRYAQARLKPSASSHTLKFVIENASVHHELVNSGNKVGDWLRVGRSEKYEISIALRLYTESAPGIMDGAAPATLTFTRSTHIPADYSIAAREAEQLRFLEQFIADIDKAVTSTLQQKLRLAAMLLPPPEGKKSMDG